MAAAVSDVCVLGNGKCGIWYIKADDDKVGQDHFGGAAFFDWQCNHGCAILIKIAFGRFYNVTERKDGL